MWPGERRGESSWQLLSQSGISWWMEQGSGDYITWSHVVMASQGQSVARFYNSGYFINDCLAWKCDPQSNITFSVPGDTFFRVSASTRSDGISAVCSVGQWPMFCSRCIYCLLMSHEWRCDTWQHVTDTSPPPPDCWYSATLPDHSDHSS